MSKDADPLDYAANLIRYKARRLCRRPEFSVSDRPDLEQELFLAVLERLPKHDPRKSSINTFVAMVIDHACSSLIRYHSAGMRTRTREECSLNEDVRDGDDRLVERHETTPEATAGNQRLLELKLDVAAVRQKLASEELQAVMDLFAQGGTVNSIATTLGISRYAVEQHRQEIRQVFEDADLRDYL